VLTRPRRSWPILFAIAVVLGQWWAAQAGPPEYAAERADMVEKLRRSGITNRYVLAAMRRVPRHLFVSRVDRPRAYDDISIPVGGGQSIRQPSIVAITMEKLELEPGHKILQVGTECAYCTAVLCDIPLHVYVVDLREEMVRLAKSRLDALSYSAQWRTGMACRGWPDHGPYDAILVMCAANGVPDALVRQLKVGGRMVIPIGEGPEQTLECVTKSPDGKLRSEVIKTSTPLRAQSMACQKPLP